MDNLTHHRELLERILSEHTKVPYAHGDIRIQTIFDRDANHYLLMLVGRDKARRVHGCLVHVDLDGDKFLIQRDGTEYGIARELLEAGIPKERVVMSFRPPELQQIEESAVA